MSLYKTCKLLILTYLCVCLYMCVYVCVWGVWTCVVTKGQCYVSFFIISSLSLWNMVSFNLSTDLTRVAGRWTAEIHQCPPLKTGITSIPADSDFYVGSGALSSGPHAWMAITLPAKPSYEPIPICILFENYIDVAQGREVSSSFFFLT